MAVTEKNITSTGATSYTFEFEYLKTTDVKVSVNGTATTEFQVPNGAPTTVQFNSGHVPASGAAIRIYRDTNVDNLSATFYAGSAIKSQDLNDNFNQNLYVTQEAKRDAASAWQDGDETINSTETWVSDNNKVATTGAIDGRVDTKIDTALTTDVSGGDGVTIVDNNPGTGQIRVDLDADIATLKDMQSGAATQLAALTSTELAILDGATVSTAEVNLLDGVTATTAELNYVDGVTSNVQTQLDAKQPLDAELTELATMGSTTASALADLTQAEVQILDGATVTTAELNKLDGVTATTTEINYVDGVTSNVQTQLDAKQPLNSKLTGLSNDLTATAAELNILDGVTATTAELNKTDGLTSTPTELNILDGATTNTSELNKLDGFTGSTNDLNIVSGKSFKTSSGTLDTTSDTEIPSSKVIAAHVASSQTAIGGFITIADEVSFPNTQPATGVVISINNAAGVVVNSSGVSTTGRRVDSTVVTINGFPSSLNGETLAAGVGLVVTSTSTANTYAYHKLLAAETDVKQLSDDINDFNARYRVASSAPGSSNDAGDMYFDTSANKMKVYNGTTSAWDDVASVGSFYVNTISSSSGTGGGSATFNGSAYRFTLSNAGTSAQQHIVSVNGVIQKPNTGSSQPSEGFALSGNDIIFAAAPASGSDSFIITCGSSVSIGTPSANSVNSSHIIDGSIVDGDISSTANIAGSKVADDSIPEVKLDVHNAPATDKYLKYTSNGMEWSDGASEGTDVKSTGESGTTKFLRVDGDGTCSWQVPPDTQVGGATGVDFNNNAKARFGNSNYLEIFSNGTNQLIKNTSGDLVSESDSIKLRSTTGDAFVTATLNGAVDLYHNDTKRLETTSSGINVTGQINVNGAELSAAPEIDITASGAISNNQAVIVNSSGQAVAVTQSSSVASPPTSSFAGISGSTLSHESFSDACYDASTDRYVWINRDGGNGGFYVYVGQMVNGTISWGNKSGYLGFSGNCREVKIESNGAGKVFALGHEWSSWGQTKAICGTINASAKTVSFGSAINTGTAGTSGIYLSKPVWTSSTNVLQIRRDSQNSNNFRVYTYTVSGTSIQQHGLTNIAQGDSSAAMAYRNNKVAIGYRNSSNTLSVRFAYMSNSNQTINLGSTTTVSGVFVNVISVAWVNDTTAVFVFRDNTSSKGTSIAFTIGSGSTDNTVTSQGSLQYYQPSAEGTTPQVYWDNDISRLVCSYRQTISSKDTAITVLGNYTGSNSVTWDTSNTCQSRNTVNNSEVKEGFSSMNDTTNDRQVIMSPGSGGSNQTYDFSTFIVETQTITTNMTTGNFLGFSSAAYSNGQTAKINVVGNTTTKSSLTPGSKYYVQKDGSLATTATTPSVEAGLALSSTKLLIKG